MVNTCRKEYVSYPFGYLEPGYNADSLLRPRSHSTTMPPIAHLRTLPYPMNLSLTDGSEPTLDSMGTAKMFCSHSATDHAVASVKGMQYVLVSPFRKLDKNLTHISPTSISLAYAEMRLILCKLLWHFDIRLCPEIEQGNWTDQEVWFFWAKPPLMATLRDRFAEERFASD